MPTIAIDALDTPVAAALGRRDDCEVVRAQDASLSDVDALVVLSPGRGRDADGTGGGPADVAATTALLASLELAPPTRVIVLSSPLAAADTPVSAVGSSRRSLEAVVQSWSQANGVPCTVVRPGIVVDPSAAGRRWLSRSVWSSLVAVEGRNPRRRFVHVDDLAAMIGSLAATDRELGELETCAAAGSTTLQRQIELVGRLYQPTVTPRQARRGAQLAASVGLLSTDLDVFDAAIHDLVDEPQTDVGDLTGVGVGSDLAWCAGSSEAWWGAKNAHQRQMVALTVGGAAAVVVGMGAALTVRWLRRRSAA